MEKRQQDSAGFGAGGARFVSPRYREASHATQTNRLCDRIIAPRALATSGRRPGVRAKRAARGVAGHQVWTGTHEKRQSHNSDAERYWTSTSQDKLIT